MKRKSIIFGLIALGAMVFTSANALDNPFHVGPGSPCLDTWCEPWEMIGNGCLRRSCFCEYNEQGNYIRKVQVICIGPAE